MLAFLEGLYYFSLYTLIEVCVLQPISMMPYHAIRESVLEWSMILYQ